MADDTEALRRAATAAERILIHDHGVGDLSDDAIADLYADAVRFNLAVIAEVAEGLPPDTRRRDPRIRWDEVGALGDRLGRLEAGEIRSAVRASVPGFAARLRALIERDVLRDTAS